MAAEFSEIPQKLAAKRVRAHVAEILHTLRLHESRRDAARAVHILEISWMSFDLYTLAFDLCEEDDLRFLVGQARGAILAALIKRSANRKSSRSRGSSRG